MHVDRICRFLLPVLVLATAAVPDAARGAIAPVDSRDRPATVPLQEVERYRLSGKRAAVYNLVGTAWVVSGSEEDLVVEVARSGTDADRLQVRTGPVGGRTALRVVYPGDRIRSGGLFSGRTSLRVREDGTFDRGGGRRVRIGSGSGLDARADLTVRVPAGRRVELHLAVGTVEAADVEGSLLVDTHAADVTAEDVRGTLEVDVGSGSVRVRGVEGDVLLDTGSGRVETTDVKGERLGVDTGSGSVTGRGIRVRDLHVDTGSGRVRLSDVVAGRAWVDTGSGSVRMELVAESDAVLVDTGSGSVELTFPDGVGAEMEVKTGSGGIAVDLPVSDVRRGRGHFRGRVRDGGTRVRVETGSGSVRIRGT